MKTVITLLILFVALMGAMMLSEGGNILNTGWIGVGFIWGLVFLFWACIFGAILGVLKWLLRGAVRVTKNEWEK